MRRHRTDTRVVNFNQARRRLAADPNLEEPSLRIRESTILYFPSFRRHVALLRKSIGSDW
jgi:hypothetical protein